ncbi:hypothetical protein BDZ94DRAFT_1275108 [Collybia nuda]|uniref:Uncharacterized protein n=1 Tax=Collybia nuda TaxID=64659 RepID=A0A9P6CD55_9AGAR|nr:hypothetical protein BDZ94DRAFT_1275108 [Collybia nuda]
MEPNRMGCAQEQERAVGVNPALLQSSRQSGEMPPHTRPFILAQNDMQWPQPRWSVRP